MDEGNPVESCQPSNTCILHSGWADTSSWKTLLKTTLDNGPQMRCLARKATLMMRDHAFGHGVCLAVQTIQVKRRKGKGKRTGEGRSKRTRRVFFGDERAQDPEWWSEEDFAWWSEGKKSKNGLSKSIDGIQKVVFRPYQPDKGAGKDYLLNKGR